MIDCLIDWVKFETFLKVKWEGIKGLSQTFIFAFMISVNSNSFHHKTLERRWHDFFHLFKWRTCLKNIWIPLGNVFPNLETLCKWMIFTSEDKMTSSNYMKYELGVSKKLKFKIQLNLFFNLELFEFYSNYFSPKIKYMENRVTWFTTLENWRKIYLKSFWYFFKMIFIGFY